MKQTKSAFSVFLAIVMVLTIFAGLNFSTIAETQGVLTYEINDGEATITDCDESTSGELIIPDTLGGYPVTEIGYAAFFNCSGLTKITIPNSVKSIAYGAFQACSGLECIILPNSIRRINSYLFAGCTSLNHITIPDSVTVIEMDAFVGCTSLTSITIPDSVTSIGEYAFIDTEYYNNESNWENDVLYIGNHLIEAKDTISGSYTIKDGTVSIADNAFADCINLIGITIPDSVTCIGEAAFSSCTSLTSIIIPDSVTSVDASAFTNTGYYNDESNWENEVLYIGNHLIKAKETIDGSYTVKDGTVSIADDAFYDCVNMTSIIIPESVSRIGSSAFKNCTGLTTITLPDGATRIDCDAFDNTGYYNDESNWEDDGLYLDNYLIRVNDTISGSYSIKNGTTCIAGGAFQYSSLTTISIPESVTTIGDNAFSFCFDLMNITIPKSVTSIGSRAFFDCKSLKSLVIPETVTYIGSEALGYQYASYTRPILLNDFVIYGTPGTAAETYANDNGITFVAVSEVPPTDEPTTEEPTTAEVTTEEPTTAEVTTEEPTTTAPTTKAPETPTKAPTTQAPTTTEPTTKASDELIIKDTDSGITVPKDEPIVSIEAVGNKGLTAGEIKAKLGNASVSIVNKDGVALADDARVGTGCVIQVLGENGEVLSPYTVLVPMDVNGDAEITAQDARAALRAAAQLESLDDIYLRAAKTDADKALSAADARRILRKAAHLE